MALYRVILDCSFASKADADALSNYAKTLISKASHINEGKVNEEVSSIRTHVCLHDEGKPCPEEAVTIADKKL
jgi:hypothetical protein